MSGSKVILNAFFPGEPTTWKRARGHGRRRFNPKFMVNAQKRLRRQFQMLEPKWKADDESRFGIQVTYNISQLGDGSNFQKLLEDAFNGVIWGDDEQIDEWQGRKVRYREQKGIHLIVYTISA